MELRCSKSKHWYYPSKINKEIKMGNSETLQNLILNDKITLNLNNEQSSIKQDVYSPQSTVTSSTETDNLLVYIWFITFIDIYR